MIIFHIFAFLKNIAFQKLTNIIFPLKKGYNSIRLSTMFDTGYIKAFGIYYPSELKTIGKKNDIQLQPIFEAFTNSLEAIRIFKERYHSTAYGEIEIKFFRKSNAFSKENNVFNYDKIEITDTGIGLEDSEFERFINLRDDRKNFSNKGTGRVQFLHFFEKTLFNSIYIDKNSPTGYRQRRITLSKNEAFLSQNSIIRYDSVSDVVADNNKTIVTFENVLSKSDETLYRTISAKEIKRDLIRHYLAGFCENRNNLPNIIISIVIDNKEVEHERINSNEIPEPSNEAPIEVFYSKLLNGKIEKSENKESFKLKSFVLPENELDKNCIKLVSKGEIATEIKLDNILPIECINKNRYLFLLSGEYIDKRDSDVRGNINIPKAKDFKKNEFGSELFDNEQILIEDIESTTNKAIATIFDEINEKKKEKELKIDELQSMFLLKPETLELLKNKIHIGDNDDTILRKVYEAEAKAIAENDAEIKHLKELIKQLNPKDKDYRDKLDKQANEFVKTVSLQNRTALTQYIARRKLVLDLFDDILKNELEKFNSGGRIDEALLHNLIFQQHTDKSDKSDLWLINEDFIYFNGISEARLCDVEIKGKNLFKKEELDVEEKRYLNSLGEKRLTQRPDVLLFPDEGKCIIIEFKAPDVNVSDHISQIDFYASLIRNYTKEEFNILTFYGYLIGESIEDRDVRGRVNRFEHAYNFDYWFRPSENVHCFDGRINGSLYTEVIKYTTLLKRAQLRNEIFTNFIHNKE